MNYARYTVGHLLAAAALTGCLFGNSSDAPADLGEMTQTIPYRVEGNAILLGPTYFYSSYCVGDGLRRDTSLIEEYGFTFKVEGSTFTILADTAILESGAALEQRLQFSREGSGSGLEGLWSETKKEQRLVSGTLTQEEKDRMEDDQRSMTRYSAYYRSWLQFTGGKLIFYEKREHAKLFVSNWNGEFATMPDADSARYAITVKAVDQNTVELKGRENGETVRITQSFEGRTYSSDEPGHALHRFFYKPETCPNVEFPLWYQEFLDANAKLIFPKAGLEKSAEIHKKSRNPSIFPFGPLKTEYSLLN